MPIEKGAAWEQGRITGANSPGLTATRNRGRASASDSGLTAMPVPVASRSRGTTRKTLRTTLRTTLRITKRPHSANQD